MLVSTVIEKTIAISAGSLHDTDHFLKAYALAKTIGEAEGLDARTQETLELAAVVHDIACPLCREKYGNTLGKHQEQESAPLVDAFFAELPACTADAARISWLVSHHHTYTDVDSLDHWILLEADFLVNAGESGYTRAAIETAGQRVFRTAAGIRLLDSMYLGV